MPTGRADHNLIKRLNSALILNNLLSVSPQSRANLAERTGLNRSTVSSLVSDLIDQALVREVGLAGASERGRPGMMLELNPTGGCIVGVEINVGYATVLVTDFTARTLWRQHIEVDEDIPQDEFLALVEDLIAAGLQAGTANGLKPLGIGLGLPGLIDTENKRLVFAPNLGWRDVSFCDRWEQRFRVPLYVENDGNASALGEYYFGVAKGHEDFLFIATGTGLSAGMMLNNHLYRGAGGYAGEIGHIIVESGGDLCNCGRRGCWETLVSPPAIMRGILHALNSGAPSIIPDLVGDNLDRLNMRVVVEAADQGDQLALDTLLDTALNLGVGIANLVNIFNPAMIVLGGTLISAGDYLLPTISNIITAEALSAPAGMVALALSSQGTDSCVKGAVALVIDGIVREPVFT
ncbi:MAG: ROK family protein [Chloroflexi bacterium]|nr:ROK family protein [Chloroflexota bacterium]